MTFTEWLDHNKYKYPKHAVEQLLSRLEQGASTEYILDYQNELIAPLQPSDVNELLDLHRDFLQLQKKIEKLIAELKPDETLEKRVRNARKNTLLNDLLAGLRCPKELSPDIFNHAETRAYVNTLAQSFKQDEFTQIEKSWSDSSQLMSWDSLMKDLGQVHNAVKSLLSLQLQANLEVRELARQELKQHAYVVSEACHPQKPTRFAGLNEPLQDYLDPQKRQHTLPRYMALRRAEKAQEITLLLSMKNYRVFEALQKCLMPERTWKALDSSDNHGLKEFCESLIQQSCVSLLKALRKEIFFELALEAEKISIDLCAQSFEKLLLSPALGFKPVIGAVYDHGRVLLCALDSDGLLIEKAEFHLKDQGAAVAAASFMALMQKHNPAAVGVANLPQARELELFLRQSLKEFKVSTPVILINEQGLIHYATGKAAEKEFKELEAPFRAAVSVGRRLQNPLYEFAKVDPRVLGLGQYQDELNPTRLKYHLNKVLSRCLHKVGIQVNVATPEVLVMLGGPKDKAKELWAQIRKTRMEQGAFTDLEQVFKVNGWNQDFMEFAGPYLRIHDSRNPLDHTQVHPKYYEAIRAECKDKKLHYPEDVLKAAHVSDFNSRFPGLNQKHLDPRAEFVAFQYRDDITRLKDLRPGLVLHGRVGNLTSFGVFVDVGVGQDGLVHISELSGSFESYRPGDIVQVRVLDVDHKKQKISLSCFIDKNQPKPRVAPHINSEQRPQSQSNSQAQFDFKATRNNEQNKQQNNKQRDSRSQRPDRDRHRTPYQKSTHKPNFPNKSKQSAPLTENPFAALANLKNK